MRAASAAFDVHDQEAYDWRHLSESRAIARYGDAWRSRKTSLKASGTSLSPTLKNALRELFQMRDLSEMITAYVEIAV
jgi:hypothetical protein